MCAFDTTPDDVDRFASAVRRELGAQHAGRLDHSLLSSVE